MKKRSVKVTSLQIVALMGITTFTIPIKSIKLYTICDRTRLKLMLDHSEFKDFVIDGGEEVGRIAVEISKAMGGAHVDGKPIELTDRDEETAISGD